MKQLRKNLRSLSKDLKSFTQRAEKAIKALERFEKAEAKKVSGKKAATRKAGARGGVKKKVAPKRAKASSATDKVLKIINRSKRGVDTATLQKKTGFNRRKIWDIVHRGYKEGKIKKVGRGAYAKA